MAVQKYKHFLNDASVWTKKDKIVMFLDKIVMFLDVFVMFLDKIRMRPVAFWALFGVDFSKIALFSKGKKGRKSFCALLINKKRCFRFGAVFYRCGPLTPFYTPSKGAECPLIAPSLPAL